MKMILVSAIVIVIEYQRKVESQTGIYSVQEAAFVIVAIISTNDLIMPRARVLSRFPSDASDIQGIPI